MSRGKQAANHKSAILSMGIDPASMVVFLRPLCTDFPPLAALILNRRFVGKAAARSGCRRVQIDVVVIG
jgi:hypothetical protein